MKGHHIVENIVWFVEVCIFQAPRAAHLLVLPLHGARVVRQRRQQHDARAAAGRPAARVLQRAPPLVAVPLALLREQLVGQQEVAQEVDLRAASMQVVCWHLGDY